MRTLITFIGLALMMVSANTFAADRNQCDDLFDILVERYKAAGKDVLEVHNDEQLLKCFDLHQQSEHYKEKTSIAIEKAQEEADREAAIEFKEFTRQEIAQLLLFAFDEDSMEKSKLVARRRDVELKHTQFGRILDFDGRGKEVTNPDKLCRLLTKSEKSVAVYLTETEFDIDNIIEEEQVSGKAFQIGKKDKSFKTFKSKKKGAISYVEGIKCVIIENEEFEDALDNFQDSFTYRDFVKKKDQEGTNEIDGNRDGDEDNGIIDYTDRDPKKKSSNR